MLLIIASKTLILFKEYIECNAIKMFKHLVKFVRNEERKLISDASMHTDFTLVSCKF